MTEPVHVSEPLEDALTEALRRANERGLTVLRSVPDEERDQFLEERHLAEIREQHLARCRERAIELVPPQFQRGISLPDRVETEIDRWFDQVWSATGRDREFDAGRNGLCFVGRPGAGKTHTVWMLLRRLLEHGHEGIAFRKVQELFDELRSLSNNSRTDEPLIQRLASVDILALDDLGAKPLTEFREERLLRILDLRYEKQRPTLFTTNIGADKFTEFFGGRIASRIGGMTRVVTFPNYDWRTGIDYSKGRA